jgi:ATP-dependent helicase/nuclease subunit A
VLKIYKSSAGSGKTFTLVKEYLKLCLSIPDRFRYVVAITFTIASAAEMKDRILRALKELSEGKAEDLRDQLIAEGISPLKLANAPLLLEKILFNYSLFNIRTIDSFFQKIIRSFNRELDIPSDFEVYINSDEALDYTVDQFLSRSREQPDIHRLLIDYIREKISSSQSWNIRSDLYRISKELLKDKAHKLPETDLLEIQEYIKTLKKLIRDFESEMDAIAKGFLFQMEAYGLMVDDFKNKKSGVLSFILKSRKEIRKYEPNIRFVDGLNDPTEWYTKTSPNARLIEEAMLSSLLPQSIRLYETYLNHYKRYTSAREILKTIYTFSVYEELNKMLQEYRNEKNVLLIADFTRLLSDHISNENLEFVYSKIGNRYDHYLIDEFQDTSALQWLSLKPLIENAVSQGAGCLIVGDSKQAIYRWRGGSIELIEKQVIEIDFPAHSEKHQLNRNFRSRPTIVDFNNLFFKKVSALFSGDSAEYSLMQQIFEDSEQQSITDTLQGGFAEVNFINKDGRTKETFLEPARRIMLEQIRKCIDDGYTFEDITVLVRDKKSAGDIAGFLNNENFPFITQDSLNLDHSPVVRFLLSLLNYLDHPMDDLILSEVLFLYVSYFYPEGAAEDAASKVYLNFHSSKTILPYKFLGNIEKLCMMQVYEIVEELVHMFSLDVPDAYLQRFQDAVLEFSLKEKGGIRSFLEWWKKGKFTVVLPENQDAIRIMTIHKAKGLEFPVVIIPFADWEFSSGPSDIIWVKPEEEPFNEISYLPVSYTAGLKDSIFAEDYQREEALTAIDNLNLLYVAFTRAKHRLYVNTVKVKKQPDNRIKSIPMLINSVLNPESDKLVFGTETPADKKNTEADKSSNYLQEYLVFSKI